MFSLAKGKIARLIVYRVSAKTKTADAQSSTETSLFELADGETKTLVERIEQAMGRPKKSFKLEIAETGDKTFHHFALKSKKAKDPEFITVAKEMAELLARSHQRHTIPSGLLLVLDGETDKKRHFVVVIKAEIQDALRIDGEDPKTKRKKLRLITDLFLSPAKDFYKIGVLVEDSNLKADGANKTHSCYVYDDDFDSAARDLSVYFYKDFLGFKTDSNDKLLTKSFFELTTAFIDDYATSVEDGKSMTNALWSLITQDQSQVISPEHFMDNYIAQPLREKFEKKVVSKVKQISFTNDASLLDRKLQRKSLNLGHDIKLTGPTTYIDHNVTAMSAQNVDFGKLKLEADSGKLLNLIAISTAEIKLK